MSKTAPAGPAPRVLIVIAAVAVLAALAYTYWSTRTPAPSSSAPPAAVAPPVADDPPAGATFAQLVQTGNLRMDARLWANAVRYYERALGLDPGAVDVWVDQGACRHALGDSEGARFDFRRALALDSLHEIAHFNMGITFMTDGQPDSARAWWGRLLDLAPSGPQADRARQLLLQLDSAQG